MKRVFWVIALALTYATVGVSSSAAQERKLEKIRVGSGSVGAPQLTTWFAKEANFYEKHGLAIEAISIPGSSMAIQAMRSGEVPIKLQRMLLICATTIAEYSAGNF
jgi:ABC-type nitrate/sulfonate/bicarbonate transport system substrate-binding protein